MGDEFYRKQRELMTKVVAENDAVITTAAIPGKKSPVLVTAEMVAKMAPGSAIVDLAAERGGNCELTKADQRVVEHGVTILGPTNLPSEAACHASQMYAKNITTFLLNMVKDKQFQINAEDEIVRDTLICRDGQVVNPRIQQLLA
jgi:NAD(P) transhydrogenase subunit alpha